MSEDKITLVKPENRKTIALENYKERKGVNIERTEAGKMNEYVERKEFEQFEKRMDDNFRNLNSKIDSLPETFNDKLQIALNTQMEKLRKEQKEDKKSIIGWTIAGTGIIISIFRFFF